MKKKVWSLLMIVMLLSLLILDHSAKAASATIEFSTKKTQLIIDESFTVVCTVKSNSVFLDTDFYVNYDTKFLKFESGGSKVNANNGILHVSSVDNSSEVNKRTFSLKFKAKKVGSTLIYISDRAKVTALDNSSLSVSSNRLSMNIMNEESEVRATPEIQSTSTHEVRKSNNVKLKSLHCSGLKGLEPSFNAKTTFYETTVDADTNILYFSYQTGSKKAKAVLSGNEELREGLNIVSVTVTAESGKTKVYQINVKKESEAQTKERQKKEKGDAEGVEFGIRKKAGKLYLKNTYDFLVLDVIDETSIPSGYVKTKIRIDGTEIPAYTMQNDMDNRFLLLYLQGSNKQKGVYQYDREEKTLQRYTGDMIHRVNKSGENGYVLKEPVSEESLQNTALIAVIVGLSIIILSLLAYILTLVSKNRNMKHHLKYDDLDF